ncbi:sensor histidine kinase [Evansella cellulosilytica]|uniref:histidine kinase n=1 Tax=Evansella cellulosilytica (strain ATCC 21833 / DSM 2522 / FERM P-1141 / JCM 9156 / N-4) TaxID=649639 RepID=E6TXG5_EVAC2|nr:HAMP domain-containing sensor histidine kinase [Evansella cellulosilytica]ADU28779.1 integral membrane sensor signal transduction histidine kinase [Evansella cellulosilytica DSM 2522]
MDSVLFDYIQLVLLNLSFIFILFFIYHKFLEDKYKHSTALKVLVSGISIVLCMTFSINLVNEGYYFDMRLVPFIIGALYGGRRIGLILFIILLSYRYLLGGEGFYVTMFEYTTIYVLLWFLIPLFSRVNKIKQKVKIAVIISAVDMIGLIIMVGFININEGFSILPFVLASSLYIIQILGVILFVIFIEKAREENEIVSEVKRLEKLRIVGDIAASISHEIRNPLTVTRGFLQFMKRNDITPDKRTQYIDFSLGELSRAEDIINDYLTFAKPTLENVMKLDVLEELKYVKNVVTPFALINNVEILFKNTAEVFVIGEKQKLHQCLINIVKNGVEAMPDGGILTIDLQMINKHAHIAIQDTGIGMNREQIERLGSPYYSTKDKGTGLGTMVVYSIVKAMNGKMNVASELNKGTTITLVFPVVV